MMSRRLLFLNLALLTLIVLGIVRLRYNVQVFAAGHRVDQIRPESDKPLPKTVAAAAVAAKQEWPDIATHNPFSFDRNDVAIVVSQPAPQQPKRPKPLLYGTISFGKDPLAMLAPGDAPARSSRPVHAGEIFDGWSVVEIQDKTVIVKWDEVKETLIIDPTALTARDYTKTAGSGPALQPVVAVAPAAAPVTPAATAPSSNPFAPQPTTVSPTGKRQILVHTPFGDKIMDDPNQ
jgi:hypothetical protein